MVVYLRGSDTVFFVLGYDKRDVLKYVENIQLSACVWGISLVYMFDVILFFMVVCFC